MNRLCTLVLVTAALPSGCVSSQPTTPALQLTAPLSRSLVSQQARSRDLIYVGGSTYVVDVLSYPDGTLISKIFDYHLRDHAAFCSDASGNVFIPAQPSNTTAIILEYAHGGTTPIQTLSAPLFYPVGCSVDPTTGNLAVTFAGQRHGTIAIYANAQGSPVLYKVVGANLCGYDANGNLFVDGDEQPDANLYELPRGGTQVKRIALSHSVSAAGIVQWDGRYITVEDRAHRYIYRVKVTGSKGTIVGTTKLGLRWPQFRDSWIEGGTVIATGGLSYDYLGFWKYPAGGKPVRLVTGFGSLDGITVSVAPSLP